MSVPIRPTGSPVAAAARTFFGKYRGTVVNNLDPMQMGRVQAQVVDVLGPIPSAWALPCVPAAGIQAGVFVVPPIGSQVWMEFEGGHPDHPIWTGGFWATAAQVPVLAYAPAAVPPGQNIVLQTTGGNVVMLSDAASPATGGVVLKSADGASITVNATGIYLDNGKGASITLVGPAVTFNYGASLVGDLWTHAPRTS